MNERTKTIKGRLMALAAAVAVAGPWRGAVERLTCAVGHTFPTSRTVVSFCRHFGGRLIQRDAERFERIVTFSTGGKMRCGGERGEERVGLTCLMHYFLGTITGQHEDEQALVKLLSLAVRKGDTFFDIGANVGFYSWFIGPLCGTSGTVHAFEANPLLIPHLRRSAKINEPTSNIIVNAVAVGKDSDTTLELYDPERIGGSSLYKLDWLNAGSSVTVPLTTIDSYRRANNITGVDVVKIDIEGAELDAFRGMEETFEKCPPGLIVCELIPTLMKREERAAGGPAGSRPGNPLEIIEFLRARGYEPRYVNEHDGRVAGRVERGDIEGLSQDVINIAFVRPAFRAARPELFSA